MRDLTEQQFSIWKNQLRAWLASDDSLAPFLPTGQYNTWESEETNPHRITELVQPGPDLDLRENPTEAQRTQLLDKRRRQLDIFLSQVASCVSLNHYNTVVRHATSLQWVHNKIREDYGIVQRGINFMNLRHLKYNQETMTPSGYYHQYRSHFINHTARAGQRIEWSGQDLVNDETIGPTTEDLILYSVISQIDGRLLEHIHKHYQLKMTVNQRLMDVRTDIFHNIPEFLKELDGQLGAITVRAQQMSLAPIQQQPVQPAQPMQPVQYTQQHVMAPISGVDPTASQTQQIMYSVPQSAYTGHTAATGDPSTVQLAAFARMRGRGRGLP